MIELSLILPVYNQADIIKPVFGDIYRTFTSLGCSCEFILVENGSTDDTKSVTRELAGIFPHTLTVSTKKGYGSAVLAGLLKARGEDVCYLPSDGQVDLTVIGGLWS